MQAHSTAMPGDAPDCPTEGTGWLLTWTIGPSDHGEGSGPVTGIPKLCIGSSPDSKRMRAYPYASERCPGQDSNLHGQRPGDFKSPAFTHFATRAQGRKSIPSPLRALRSTASPCPHARSCPRLAQRGRPALRDGGHGRGEIGRPRARGPPEPSTSRGSRSREPGAGCRMPERRGSQGASRP